jgi:hypothetical protein
VLVVLLADVGVMDRVDVDVVVATAVRVAVGEGATH